MSNIRFDWRWVAVIAGIAMLAAGGYLPWIVRALVLFGGGGYLLWDGWQRWAQAGGLSSNSKVTYWRGQRYEVAPRRSGMSMPRWQDIGPAVLPLLSGSIMVLVGVALTLDRLGY